MGRDGGGDAAEDGRGGGGGVIPGGEGGGAGGGDEDEVITLLYEQVRRVGPYLACNAHSHVLLCVYQCDPASPVPAFTVMAATTIATSRTRASF